MYSEKHVFLRKQGGTYLAYDCTEVTTVAFPPPKKNRLIAGYGKSGPRFKIQQLWH